MTGCIFNSDKINVNNNGSRSYNDDFGESSDDSVTDETDE